MTAQDRADLIAQVRDPAIRESVRNMLHDKPWPEMPEPPPVPLYPTEKYKEHYAAYVGDKLIAVALYKKGADEICRMMTHLHRRAVNAEYQARGARYDAKL